MSDVTLSYKGSDILELSDSGSATLKTGGTYCEADIEVEYVKPSGTVPTGTKQISITQNGTTTEDVSGYANAEINVDINALNATSLQLTSFKPANTGEVVVDLGDADVSLSDFIRGVNMSDTTNITIKCGTVTSTYRAFGNSNNIPNVTILCSNSGHVPTGTEMARTATTD